MKAIRILVSGRVQGVWYRASTQREAVGLGLCGWVRNLADGSVEILAQGEAGKIKMLCDWCRQGPPGARVDELVIEDAQPDSNIDSFRVRY